LLAGVYALLRNRGVSPLSGQDTARVLRHFSNRFQVSMERVSGSPKRFSQTLREFSDIHRTSLEPIWADVELFIPLIERAMFSEVGISETELAELNGRLSELEKRAKLLQKERVQSARKLKRAP
jgi:Sec7-like guanine-nucleotide exchange factor